MPPAGFEPRIPAKERPQTQAIDREATGSTQGDIKLFNTNKVDVSTCTYKLNVIDEVK